MNESSFRLGLMSAMREEQANLISQMQDAHTVTRGMRDYVIGRLWGIECVCVLSRIGKVAAAATTATLIEHFNVTHIVFTGVAGGIERGVQVGDLVVADTLVQHDMNAAPLFPQFEIPLVGISHFASDVYLSDRLSQAASDFIAYDYLDKIASADRETLMLAPPQIHRGLIASGDEFIHNPQKRVNLQRLLPNLLAVEMEGAAVAQVCFEFGVPYAVIRTISDSANGEAARDFTHFIDSVASCYAFYIVKRFCTLSVDSGLKGNAFPPLSPTSHSAFV